MANGFNKDVKKLIKELELNGCVIKLKSGANHYQIKIPNGGIVSISLTPSNRNWRRAVKKDLKAQGLKENILVKI